MSHLDLPGTKLESSIEITDFVDQWTERRQELGRSLERLPHADLNALILAIRAQLEHEERQLGGLYCDKCDDNQDGYAGHCLGCGEAI